MVCFSFRREDDVVTDAGIFIDNGVADFAIFADTDGGGAAFFFDFMDEVIEGEVIAAHHVDVVEF